MDAAGNLYGQLAAGPFELSPSPRETLNKCSFSTTSKDKVAPDEISKSTEDTGDDDGIRAVYEEDAAGNLFRRDGAGGAVGKVVRLDRAPLSEARKRATAERTGKDAAD